MTRPISKSLAGALDKAWTFPDERGRQILNHPSKGDLTGASDKSGEGLLAYLTGLVSRGAKGTKGIPPLGLEESGQVAHAHSLFCASAGGYAEPDLCGVLGPIIDHGTPVYI